MTAFLLLLAGSAALLVALASLVAGRKALREAPASVRSAGAQVDLAAVLEDPARAAVDPAVLEVEARCSGLSRRLQRQLSSRRAPARGRAVLILAHLRPGGRVGALERMLDDDDPDVRLATCAGLPLARDDEAVGALVRALGHRRLAPERVIERVGHPWAVGALLEALRELDEAGERRAAPRVGVARALGVAGDPRGEQALIDLLRRGSTEERTSAARALGSAGGARARRELERALRDPSWPLRAQAAKALGKIGVARSAPALAAVLDDPAWWVRANAGTALPGAPGHGRERRIHGRDARRADPGLRAGARRARPARQPGLGPRPGDLRQPPRRPPAGHRQGQRRQNGRAELRDSLRRLSPVLRHSGCSAATSSSTRADTTPPPSARTRS